MKVWLVLFLLHFWRQLLLSHNETYLIKLPVIMLHYCVSYEYYTTYFLITTISCTQIKYEYMFISTYFQYAKLCFNSINYVRLAIKEVYCNWQIMLNVLSRTDSYYYNLLTYIIRISLSSVILKVDRYWNMSIHSPLQVSFWGWIFQSTINRMINSIILKNLIDNCISIHYYWIWQIAMWPRL